MSSNEGDDEDPFACFGGEDDVEEEEADVAKHINPSAESEEMVPFDHHYFRDPSCGVLTFHAGTEQSLLRYVKLELAMHSSPDGGSEVSKSERSDIVLRIIDKFCLSRHWMMHLGKEKGIVVQDFLKEFSSQYQNDATDGTPCPLTLVELGTYCGYSSILLAKTMVELGKPFHLFTIEVDRASASVASELIQLASLDKHISILLLDPEVESLSKLLNRRIRKLHPNLSHDQVPMIDFLFIDHDKSLYLSDLQQLEKSGFIRCGSFVAADNVVFAQIDDYRHHMGTLSQQKIVQTELKEAPLEYSGPDCDESNRETLLDGVELSVYLQNPVHHIGS